MMKKLTGILVLGGLLLGLTGISMAQANQDAHDVVITVASIAVLDLNNTGNITLDVTAPATGGDDPVGDSDATKYLQYTSTVGSSQTRTITAQLTGTMPAGLSLSATATPGGGEGTTGNKQNLTDGSSKTLIAAIPSCATGTGGSDGANINYELEITDASALVTNAAGSTVTITYTLTDVS